MPVPVVARSVEERELLTGLASVRSVLELVERADVSFVGVGAMGDSSAIVLDGFITREEDEELRGAGAVGEITGWAFDSHGRLIEGSINDRVASAPPAPGDQPPDDRRRHGPFAPRRVARGAAGKLISGLVTDEATAEHLLQR